MSNVLFVSSGHAADMRQKNPKAGNPFNEIAPIKWEIICDHCEGFLVTRPTVCERTSEEHTIAEGRSTSYLIH